MMPDALNFAWKQLSVAMTDTADRALRNHLDKGAHQEDLTFAYWRPSEGATRVTAIISEIAFPRDGERVLHGNVAFERRYLARVLAERPDGAGIALMHSHLTPGWQDMSDDDVIAERDSLAGPVWGQTRQPILGLTRGTDGSWSARFWVRSAPGVFERRDAASVRVVGRSMRITRLPRIGALEITSSQHATASVWGERAQQQLATSHVGIVGLGSVGSIVAEALARIGFSRLTLIDFDTLEEGNRDRTAGATVADVAAGLSKVQLAARNIAQCATCAQPQVRPVQGSLLEPDGLQASMDCEVLISCVDRPWPRFVLNSLAYAHLIPVIDGGIAAGVKPDGTPLHVDWRIHTVGPGNACLICQDALRRGEVALDMEGCLDDPDYIRGLPESERARFSRRNVFPFSLSVAAHEVLQLVGLLTGMTRVGGIGSQAYHGYPGTMTVSEPKCEDSCEFAAQTALATDQSANIAKT